jgi:hypothetical protein
VEATGAEEMALEDFDNDKRLKNCPRHGSLAKGCGRRPPREKGTQAGIDEIQLGRFYKPFCNVAVKQSCRGGVKENLE